MRILNVEMDDFYLQQDGTGTWCIGPKVAKDVPNLIYFADKKGMPTDIGIDARVFTQNDWYIDFDNYKNADGVVICKDSKISKNTGKVSKAVSFANNYSLFVPSVFSPDGKAVSTQYALLAPSKAIITNEVKIVAMGSNGACVLAIPKTYRYALVSHTETDAKGVGTIHLETVYSGCTGEILSKAEKVVYNMTSCTESGKYRLVPLDLLLDDLRVASVHYKKSVMLLDCIKAGKF